MARSVSHLKEEARRAEKRENWSRAIDLYAEALRLSEERGDLSLDLSLYNRIGDLHRRLGATEEAVAHYREAVEKYAEQGLHTGAIALCNKILRLAPDEMEMHRMLGRLHAESGLMAEARESFQEYARHLQEQGEDGAVRSVSLELAELVSDADLLRATVEEMWREGQRDEARQALEELLVARPPDAEPERDFDRAVEALLRELAPEALEAEDSEPAVEPGPSGRAPDHAGEEAGVADAGGPSEEPEPTVSGDPELSEIAGAGEDSEAGDAEAAGGAPAARPGADEDEAEPSTGRPGPEAAPQGPDVEGEEGVDLGARIRSRLEGETGRPSRPGAVTDEDDGARDFDEMLLGFRAQVEETSGKADPSAHVELGVALREMGFVEDAIREFQVAARAQEPSLQAFELLGACFMEQGLHSVAVRVLNRALRLPGYSDHDLLGVLYQLGIAYQQEDEVEQALDCFERVYSVDIDFRDVAERMEAVRQQT